MRVHRTTSGARRRFWRKEKVQDRQGLAEAAGLKASILDVESFASRLATSRLIEQLPGQGQDAVVALFEVRELHRVGRRDQEVLSTRDQAFGGAQLGPAHRRRPGYCWKKWKRRSAAANCPRTTRLAC